MSLAHAAPCTLPAVLTTTCFEGRRRGVLLLVGSVVSENMLNAQVSGGGRRGDLLLIGMLHTSARCGVWNQSI